MPSSAVEEDDDHAPDPHVESTDKVVKTFDRAKRYGAALRLARDVQTAISPDTAVQHDLL